MELEKIADADFLAGLEKDLELVGMKQPKSVTREDHVVLAQPDPGFKLCCDIYYKEKCPPGKRPCVIFLHDWAGGNNPPICGDRQGGFFALHDIVFITLYYRPPKYKPCPAALEDLKTCARWARAHSEEYAIDPDMIVSFGSSAGSQWAAMAAITNGQEEFENPCGYNEFSSDINLVLLNAGICDVLRDFVSGDTMEIILGTTHDESPETFRKFSPLQNLHAGMPPVLLIHGTEDESCSIEAARAFRDRLQELGVEAKLIERQGCPHSATREPGDFFKNLTAWKDFVLAHRPPRPCGAGE